MSLIAELKRRNIFRVAVLYLLAGWVILQLTGLLLGFIGRGEWVYRFMFGMGVICFPLALIFSYLYEITPQGLRKEHLVKREHSITRRTGRMLNKAILWSLVLAVAIELGRLLFG